MLLMTGLLGTHFVRVTHKYNYQSHLCKKGDKTDCSNYRGKSLLSTSYKILSNILPSRLSPYISEIIGDHQCGFRSNRSTTDQIFCIHQTLEKKWEYSETVHKLFVDFKKAYDSVKVEVLYNRVSGAPETSYAD
jgi:hypothetical protein